MTHEEKRALLLLHWPEAVMNAGAARLDEEFNLYEIVPFCGCGTPAEAAAWLRDLLQILDGFQERRWERMRAHFGTVEGDSPPVYWVVNYFIDHLGWTEHGGSVPGWLTDKGRAAIVALDALIESENEGMVK